MHKVGDEYWLYFVARDKLTRELCIGMARSQNPEGPFVAAPQPILTANVIDPHVFVKDKDAVFLYWKEDNNDVWPAALNDLLYDHPELIPTLFDGKEEHTTASFILTIWPWARLLEPMERFMVTQVLIETVISGYKEFYEKLGALMATQSSAVQEKIRRVLQNMKTPMFAQQLSVDGSSLIGERTKIIENDLDWEAHLVEGMWVTEHNNKYYLFYAGNDFSTDQYGIGVAVADSPLGPYNKMPKQFLKSTEEWWAPGHPSVVTGPDGTPQLLLHAYFPGKAGYKQFRALLSVPLVFEEDKVSIKPRP
ncbi:MAG: hypothetical protein JWQ96_1838 [Segetibacter sp.]|nr:hypothetical protein [Segetibacter sp.]